jgi:Predicted membrane-associated Zn-dependent proteases 1
MQMVLGLLAMALAFGFLVFIHEFGHWAVARALGFKTPVFSIGFGKREWSWVIGTWLDTEWRLAPIPLGGYVSIPELGDESSNEEDGEKRPVFPVWKRLSVAVAGVTMNALFTVVALFLLFSAVGVPSQQVTATHVAGLAAPAGTIAGGAGIQSGDRLVSVGGQTVVTPEEVRSAIGAHKSTPVEIVFVREGVERRVTLTPSAEGTIGIKLGAVGVQSYQKLPLGQAFTTGLSVSGAKTGEMLHGIAVMARLVDKPAGMNESAKDVHGIVAIMSIGQQAFGIGLYQFVFLVAMLSLNLAIVNILPLPLLDGGHVIFFTIEGIFRKPVPLSVRNFLARIFIWLFLALMLLGLWNDITKPIKLP